ncbi:response regulator transcription factor [Gracilimonas sp.]|uniref:response regulator transcription factor n=1 Tax=Gracilimonas sp. TaxID=1974203 RepID=UPI0032EDB473
MDKTRLLIIEDNRLIREGLAEMFKNQEKLEVEAGSGDQEKLDQEIDRFKPHVILLNSALQRQYSLEVVQRVTERSPVTKTVVMGLALSMDEINEFMDAGATGFILKDATPQKFIKTITAVAKGEIVLPLHYTDLLLSHIVSNTIVKEKITPGESVQITQFELQLLKLLSEGLSDEELGEKLSVTPESVKFHIHNIKQNLYLFSLLDSRPD